jgi:hypothetical protein
MRAGALRPLLSIAVAVVTGLAVAVVWHVSRAPAVTAAPARVNAGLPLLPPAAPAGQQVLYGHIRGLSRTGGRTTLRFDPAWFTSGLTASAAKFADTGSRDVPNDNYTVEEGHRTLTYLMPRSARVTVLTNTGSSGISATPVTVAELLRIVNGGPHRKLFEPLASGVWIRVRIDTVQELDQQYKP